MIQSRVRQEPTSASFDAKSRWLVPAKRRVNAGLRVMKFGGSSLVDAKAIDAAAAIVADEAPQGTVVVASALDGVTETLRRMIAAASAGSESEAAALSTAFAARHRDVVIELGLARAPLERILLAIESERRRLAFRLAAIFWAGGASPAAEDDVLAAGEFLSSRIVAAALGARRVVATWIDARELVVTDDRHGSARPDKRGIAAAVGRNLRPLLCAGGLAVTGGFVGRSGRTGATTMLGRGGSDSTATILGAALPAELVERPALAGGIPIRERNTFRPDRAATTIGPVAGGEGIRRQAIAAAAR